MDGTQLGGLDWSTLIRLVVVVALAIVVRQAVMRFGTKAIDKRRDKSRNSGRPRR